jgi:arginyl-tRNA synthetase
LQEEEERVLLVVLSEFGGVVARAADAYQPYLVARYLLELARLFNSYYQKVKIVQEDKELETARVALVASVGQVLKNGLALLGIEAPEKM